uniref:DUF4806 domain-containing protein n=1 Tax=Panagrellus redivivus TaxID=6233 RepID=A0A7E4WE47_PANRE
MDAPMDAQGNEPPMNGDPRPQPPQPSGLVLPFLVLNRQNRMANEMARERAQSEALAAAMEGLHQQEQRQQPVVPPYEDVIMPHLRTQQQDESEVRERLRQNLHARHHLNMAQAAAERAQAEALAANRQQQRQHTMAQMMMVQQIQAEEIARPHFPIQLDQQELMNLQMQQQRQHSMMRAQQMHEVAMAQQMQIDEVQRPISPIHPPIYMDDHQMYVEEQERQRVMMRAQQMQAVMMDMEMHSNNVEREQIQLMSLVQRQREHQENMNAVLQIQSHMIAQHHFPMPSLDTSDAPLSSDYPHDLIRSKEHQKKKLQKRRQKVKTEQRSSTPPPRPPTPPNLSYLGHLEDLERKRLIKQIQSMDLTKPTPEQKPPELRTVRDRILELNPDLTEEEITQRVTALEKARIPNPNKVHPHIIDIAQDLRAFIDNIRDNRQLQHELKCNLNVKSYNYHDAMRSLGRWRADKDDKYLKKEFKRDMKAWRKAARKRLRTAKANLYCRQERWLTHTDCQLYQRLAIKYDLKVDLEKYNSDED